MLKKLKRTRCRWLFGLQLCGLVFVFSLACCVPAKAGSLSTKKYDKSIKAAVLKWWPQTTASHWSWWKAQLYQESLLEESAVSPVGARGLAQFMPGTWKEVSRAMGYGLVSPHIAKYAIEGGAYYMAKLNRGWSSPRPDIDRWDLARASYNAGFGNLLKAQKKSGGKPLFADIIAHLHEVTGENSRETITYVKRIHRWQREVICGLR